MKRRWRVAAAFFETAESRWLDDFMEGDAVEGGGRSFTKILRPHTPMSRGNGRQTGLAAWLSHLRHARAALAGSPDGVITCFPPLAMCTALLARLGRHEARIVAYNYNLGEFRGGAKRLLARLVAHRIDAFVVHAPSEVDSYAAYLGIPRNRVRFIPLQRGAIDIARREETEAPFLVAMGSAHRDYPTLIAAVDALAIPTIIVTRPADAEALPKTPYVTVRSNLSAAECLDLLARARLSVTPIANLATASGQVTILDAMATGVPVIATRCPGTDGYIDDGRTGLLTEPFDRAGLQGAIAALWGDADRRTRLAGAARHEASLRFSDRAAAAALKALLDDIEAGAD